MQAAVALPAPTAAPKESAATMATLTPERDTSSILRNPGMGWAMYAEEFDHALANADDFWSQVGPYSAYSSVLYIRVPWSRMEPTEGHYAWNEDANFKELIQKAPEHGQRLAFRVFR